jgi:hypothetical protein
MNVVRDHELNSGRRQAGILASESGSGNDRCSYDECRCETVLLASVIFLASDRPLKISGGRQDRRSPRSGHSATIQVSGMVMTGARMFSPHPLHRTEKSQARLCGSCHTRTLEANRRRKYASIFSSLYRGSGGEIGKFLSRLWQSRDSGCPNN